VAGRAARARILVIAAREDLAMLSDVVRVVASDNRSDGE
jgi:hypothetical protein